VELLPEFWWKSKMKVALVGQPNCGKSTIFNHIASYKAVTSNFPGSTVSFTESKVSIYGEMCLCVDLPGTYSLVSSDMAELETRNYLITNEIDAIVNVVDASVLGRSLELTLQLLELEKPMVLCLNMIDEARRKGIFIDKEKLSEILGIPVVETVASKGEGVNELFRVVRTVCEKKPVGKVPHYSHHLERGISQLVAEIESYGIREPNVSTRFLAMRFLEDDPYFLKKYHSHAIIGVKNKLSRQIAKSCGQDPPLALSSERHAKSLDIFEAVAEVRAPAKDFREQIDNVLMHPIWGYFFLVLIMYGFFQIVFKFGGYLEGPLLDIFDGLVHQLQASYGTQNLWAKLLEGIIQGFSGGIAIVLPYLVPFLLGLSLLEDLGYLPRVAYLTDIFMHRIGLHGKSVIPFILGYGCSVPAVMATRILESRRERIIASILAVMVPCSARSTVIFGLVAFYLGPNAALSIYVLNILVIAISGKIMTRIMPEEAPGLILEVPAYRVPSARVLLLKTWFRLREFIYVAWPILIVGSVVLSLIEFAHWDLIINNLLYPITYALSLPKQVGVTLIFGILRKELSLIMLMQALGTNQLNQVMSHMQMMVFTIFVVFYIPCAATIGVLWKEIGRRWTLFTILFTTGLALFLAFLTKAIWLLIHLL